MARFVCVDAETFEVGRAAWPRHHFSHIFGNIVDSRIKKYKKIKNMLSWNHEIGIPLYIGPILARFMGLQTSNGTAYKNKLRTKLHQANITSP